MKRFQFKFFMPAALLCISLLVSAMINDNAPIVEVITVESPITPVSAEFIIRSLGRAEKNHAEALVIELDTPGGLLSSTRDITKRFLAAKIPVIVYVYPEGARAASAGVFISYAANLVAMAPSTNIGAATPVNMMGANSDSSSAMKNKIMNDTIAQVKGLAEKRGRNAEWAEQAVRKAVSVTNTEAFKLNIINFISPSLDSLLKQVHGVEVETALGKKSLNTENAEVIHHEMNFRYKILEKISDPNITYLLMMAGIFGIYFELANPGALFPGVIGSISLILAFFAMQVLPFNYAGLLLILLALILFVLEVKITSYGLLTVGGIVAMIIGSLMLFEQAPGSDWGGVLQVSLYLIVAMALLTAAFFVFAVSMVVKGQGRKVTTGQEGLVGEIGIAQTELAPEGRIIVHGEIWKAYSDSVIHQNEKVKVVLVDRLNLKVERA